MLKAEITIRGPIGLHARPAADFVRVAEKYRSKVRLGKNGVWVNGRSILSILTLAAESGSKVILEVSGEDEVEAFRALKGVLERES